MAFDGSTRKDLVTVRSGFTQKQLGEGELSREDTSADERISMHPREKKPTTEVEDNTIEEQAIQEQDQIITIRNIYKEELFSKVVFVFFFFIFFFRSRGFVFFFWETTHKPRRKKKPFSFLIKFC